MRQKPKSVTKELRSERSWLSYSQRKFCFPKPHAFVVKNIEYSWKHTFNAIAVILTCFMFIDKFYYKWNYKNYFWFSFVYLLNLGAAYQNGNPGEINLLLKKTQFIEACGATPQRLASLN